jgi:LCP family protein required for cell wall assembly
MRRLALLLSIAIIVAACGGGTTDRPVPTETAAPTATTTTVAPTTTMVSTTTTTEPLADVGVFVTVADAPVGLEEAVTELYLAAAIPATAPRVAEGLVAHVSGSGSPGLGRELTATVGTVPNGDVAVVTDGTDVVLAANAEDQWQVVGASLPSLGLEPWFGDSVRQLYVIGSDARPGENQLRFRADSHHIITIQPDGSAASIVGIPRDAWVETPEGTFEKYTDVMASNGPERILGTAEILTGLDLEGYVVTGFKGFVNLVNEFGGFDLDIPFAMAEPKSDAYFSAGVQFVDGTDALAFARNRTIDGGDFTRQFHHGLIMQWAMAAVQTRDITELPGLLETLTTHTWTDLPPGDLLTFGALVWELSPFEVTNLVVEGDQARRNGQAVVVLRESAFEVFRDLADGPVS